MNLIDEAREFLCVMDKQDYADAVHALRARVAELEPMAECAAIMAVCGYFSRLRRPDAWLTQWPDGIKSTTRYWPDGWIGSNEDNFSVFPLYAGSAPVPAAQAVDVDAICNAYESGVGHRGRPTANVNPYRECTPEHEAYAIGAKGEAAQAEENVADDELRQAIARAYCNPMNASKIVDPDLIEAATAEVSNMLAAKANGES